MIVPGHINPEPISSIAPPLLGRAIASQRWSDLAFVHWRVDSAIVAPLLPVGLAPDQFNGSAWVGLIPFVLDRATLFGSPPVPYFGTFVEVNVRLYAVDDRGRRGVVFLSLEASRLAAVVAARAVFALPYVWSRTSLSRADGVFRYRSTRHFAPAKHSSLAIRPSSKQVIGDPLADFLSARWGLFTSIRGKTIFLPNRHEPWTLFEATLESLDDTLLAAAGLPGIAGRRPDSVLYSPGVTTWFGAAR